jgi:signal transduction histidine kinase
VDIAIVVMSCTHRFEAEARARGIRLTAIIRGGITQALCAPDKVERVLTNLIANSLSFTPEGGQITVTVAGAAGAVLVSVEDTGVGIAPDATERVFEPFWRADEARNPASGGAGLGLAIARGLIEAQGGRIWAEPPPVGGTRISFVLPAASDEGAGPPAATTIAVSRAHFAEDTLARRYDQEQEPRRAGSPT